MKKAFLVIIVLISFLNVFSQAGLLDNTFGDKGIIYPNKGLFHGRILGYKSIVVQPDNKFLICGVDSDNGYGGLVLMRCNPDGSLDKSFGGKGYVSKNIQYVCTEGRSVALQKDNKIVVAATVENKVAVLRFNSDGSLDNSFASQGYYVLEYNYCDTYSVAVQEDQKIILSGDIGDGSVEDIFIARFNSDGTLDNSFGKSGVRFIDIGGLDMARSLAIQKDGKIIVSGYTDARNHAVSDFFVLRTLSNGTLDTTFNKIGYNITSISVPHTEAYSFSAGIQNDGKIVLVGALLDTYSMIGNLMIRYNTDGSLDNSFGTGGIVITLLGYNIKVWSTDLTFQSDNKILVSGFYRILNDQDLIVYRYNSDGTIDMSFGNGGYSDINLGRYDERFMTTCIQSDKLLVAGCNDEYIFVLRYLLDLELGIHSHNSFDNICLIYPNPIKNEGTLKYNLQNSGNINIGLFDINGKLVQIFVNDSYRFKGEHLENLKLIRDIKPGIYIVRIWDNSFSKTITLVKE